MSDIATEPDVNTTEGFMASLLRDGAFEGIETQDEPTPAAVTPPATAGTSGTEVETTTREPEDGDQPDWEKQYHELHTLMGRQTGELGELRKQVERLAPQEEDGFDPATYVAPPITSDVEDQIAEAIQNAGGEAVARWAAVDRPDLYETVLGTWAEESGRDALAAARFDMRYQMSLQQIEYEQRQTDEQQFQAGLGEALEVSLNKLGGEYGLDVGNEEVDTLLAATLSTAPQTIKDLVVSRDEKEREDGLRVVLALAAAKGASTNPALTGDENDALQQALAHSKGQASLGGGSLRPAASTEPLAPEEGLLEALKKHILESPSTSVAEGLTYGNKS